MTDKVIVTNLSALRRKYGASGVKAIRAAVKRETERRKVPTVDILGPVLNALTDHLHLPPRNKPGRRTKSSSKPS